MNFALGLDVHKETTAYAIVNGEGHIQRKGEIKTNPKLCLDLVSWLPASAVQIGMEASTYIYPLYDALNDAGYKVKVAHPAKLHRITKSVIKHDDKDAKDIALQLLRNDFPESYMLSKEMRDKREIIRLHLKITQEQTAIKNRIYSLLARHNCRLPCKLESIKSIQMLSDIQLPQDARITLSLLTEQLNKTKSQLKTVNKLIAQFVNGSEEAQKLMKINGIGSFTAATFLIELGDWKRFQSVKQLTAYVGMIPKMSGSAHKMYYGRIRAEGNRKIRYAFGRAAESAIKKENEFKLFYVKLINKGKKRRTAISAVANKLLRTCYGVLHTQQPTYSGSLMERG